VPGQDVARSEGKPGEHMGSSQTEVSSGLALPSSDYPRTIVVVHPRENRRKCTLTPLRARSDLWFVRYRPGMQLPVDLSLYIRLSVDGPELSAADAEKGILLLDATWRYAQRMERDFAGVPPRSLRGYRTAYPRESRLFQDPPGGLASVEALYLAYRILGRPTQGLLASYRWAREFLAANGITDEEALEG